MHVTRVTNTPPLNLIIIIKADRFTPVRTAFMAWTGKIYYND